MAPSTLTLLFLLVLATSIASRLAVELRRARRQVRERDTTIAALATVRREPTIDERYLAAYHEAVIDLLEAPRYSRPTEVLAEPTQAAELDGISADLFGLLPDKDRLMIWQRLAPEGRVRLIREIGETPSHAS